MSKVSSSMAHPGSGATADRVEHAKKTTFLHVQPAGPRGPKKSGEVLDGAPGGAVWPCLASVRRLYDWFAYRRVITAQESATARMSRGGLVRWGITPCDSGVKQKEAVTPPP